jgi:hypothetical protein
VHLSEVKRDVPPDNGLPADRVLVRPPNGCYDDR